MNLPLERERLVVKDNRLIQKARYQLTVNQLKLISYIISKIKPDTKIGEAYDISVSEFCLVCGINRNHFYSDLKKLVEDLNNNKSFWITNGEVKSYITWFSEVHYFTREGRVRISLSRSIEEYLIGLTKNFTQYEFYNILALKSKYSIILFELFKSYQFQKKIKFDLEELQEILNVNFKHYYDFKRSVLDKALMEINKYTDIDVSFEVEKAGSSGKVASIIFYIKEKESWKNLLAYQKTLEKITKQDSQE